VLSKFLGTDQIDLTLSSTVTADTLPTQTFATVDDLATNVMNGRIFGGIHYRNSTIVGKALGDQVADWALARYFQPVP
jgi:hypothetical protein